MNTSTSEFVSRAGYKLNHAIRMLNIPVTNLICADLGCSTGGFTDCLLKSGASKVYSIDTAKGELAWSLRTDPRVIVMEKTNALYVSLPELVDLVVIDTGWTRQKLIIPVALKLLKPRGMIVSLVKPQYEAVRDQLHKGKVKEDVLQILLGKIRSETEEILGSTGKISAMIESPIFGDKAGNTEYLMWINT